MDDIAKSRSQLLEEAARMYTERAKIRSVGFELLQQQTNIEHLIYHSPAAILTFHLDGTVCSFSRGAEILFGYEALDVINRYASFLIPDLNLPVDGLMAYMSNRGQQQVNQWDSPIIARHADNSLLYLTAEISELRRGASFQQMLVVFHNITKQKIAEQEYARYTTNIEALVAELKDELRLYKGSESSTEFAEKDALALIVRELSQPLESLIGEVKRGLATALSKKKFAALVPRFKSIQQETTLLTEFIESLAPPKT